MKAWKLTLNVGVGVISGEAVYNGSNRIYLNLLIVSETS